MTILASADRTVSVIAARLCWGSEKAAIDRTYVMDMAVFQGSFIYNKQTVGRLDLAHRTWFADLWLRA